MSLLLDALRARKEKENGQSTEPVEFSGPVINADEVLGHSDDEPANTGISDNSSPDSFDLPGSLIPEHSKADPINLEKNTRAATTDHQGIEDESDLSVTSVNTGIGDRDTETVTTPHNAEAVSHTPDAFELSLQFDEDQVAKQRAVVDAGVLTHDKSAQQLSEQAGPTGPQSDQQARHQVLAETPPSRKVPSRTSRMATALARSMNPDPLFFIIIAFAFAGLFGSLYALLTQNDAFVSQEYTELRARQSALNELIAGQQDREPVKRVDTATEELRDIAVQISQGDTQAIQSSSVATTAGAANVAPPANGNQAPLTTSVAQLSESVTVDSARDTDKSVGTQALGSARTSDSTSEQGNDPQANVGNEESAQGTVYEIAALQNELNELRESLASQTLRISEVIAENTELRQSRLALGGDQASGNLPASGKAETENTPAVSESAIAYDKAGEVTIVESANSGVEYDFSLDKNIPETGIPKAESAVNSSQGTPAQGVSQAPLRAQGNAYSDDRADFPAILGQAFHAYSIGNLSQADALYARALQLDPYNRDANLGVAAVAMKTGNYPVATHRYRQLLSLKPDDVVAFSAMLNLIEATQDWEIENEMVLHSSRYRDTPALHAALGNYYSQTDRWGRASESYAAAVGLSPDTADYLYNLAVSLDNLGDRQAAIETYERALSLSETGFYTFSVVQASARLRVLRAN